MLVQALAALVLVAALWAVFRFAMGLRFAKAERERARAAEEARGRRVVAEIPVSEAEVVFFLEDEARFVWGERTFLKGDIAGGRLLVGGAVAREFGVVPAPASAEELEGPERWEVVVYLRGTGAVRIPCGSLREGISREIGGRVYEAVQAGGGRK